MLDAGRLNERQLMPVIKNIGMARGCDLQTLDWLWEWLNKQADGSSWTSFTTARISPSWRAASAGATQSSCGPACRRRG